jgi:ribosomal protein L20A (L18A)
MNSERLNKKFLEEFKDYNFSVIKENKISLIGSITKAKEYFIKIESILQIIHKKLVSICSIDGLLNKEKFSNEEWDILQDIALRKLYDQEAILVLNVDGYIGEQSKEEIEFFKDILERPIYYLSELKF